MNVHHLQLLLTSFRENIEIKIIYTVLILYIEQVLGDNRPLVNTYAPANLLILLYLHHGEYMHSCIYHTFAVAT